MSESMLVRESSGISGISRVRQYVTARDAGAPMELAAMPVLEAGVPARPDVVLDPSVTFQVLEGFGAAFTEAAASVYYKLSPARRSEFMQAMFSVSDGHGYAVCRTHINSCDFALGNYAYTEVPGDVELDHFCIDRDREALIPMIREAMNVAGEPIKLFASPWSPPDWMKTTGEMNHGGKLRKEYRAAWARYYARYIQEYEAEGIPIWGITVQNEPAATQVWDSCIYSGEEERDFVRDHLGPTLENEGHGDCRIIIWDHNRDLMFERASVVLNDEKAARYVWGTGFHWYGEDCFDNVQRVHDAFPDKQLIFTEGCQEGGPHIGSWDLGERYARSIINDLNRWTVAWVDWNILLDTDGGPNHVGNYCSAPVLADIEKDTLIYQSSFHYIGHFSRFIRPGAVRIGCTMSDDSVSGTAFRNPNGALVVVVMNEAEAACRIGLQCAESRYGVELPARSISTLVLD
ncbi:MAG: glycoside hydrolase family 30 protein [Pontiellaceae bacterium]|nr:glycoside hydrolase family 30 protein [Pontiellaceae bacterium]MBN2783842.1 glycoside hydrolase family 30 protein [Pontiellaceae bacterium]